VQTELVKDMTDTTQSLGILDSKFSGKNLDIQSRISGLEVLLMMIYLPPLNSESAHTPSSLNPFTSTLKHLPSTRNPKF
jgi:hypothetical protein